MPLARHDKYDTEENKRVYISTHMPLARHDHTDAVEHYRARGISTHMPLARHDAEMMNVSVSTVISTHMPLARHDSIASESCISA